MNILPPDDADRFDQRLRRLHADAVIRLSPQTLQRLRAARQAAAPARRAHRGWPWLAATACSALLAVALGLQFRGTSPGPSPAATPTAPVIAAGDDDGYDDNTLDLLDENPDLYVWLGSDAQLAMD